MDTAKHNRERRIQVCQCISILSVLLCLLFSVKHGSYYFVLIIKGASKCWTHYFHLERNTILLLSCGANFLWNKIEKVSLCWNFTHNDLFHHSKSYECNLSRDRHKDRNFKPWTPTEASTLHTCHIWNYYSCGFYNHGTSLKTHDK